MINTITRVHNPFTSSLLVRGRPYSAHAARGEGGSTKSVLMRAGGGGVSGALSAHAKSLHRGLDLHQEEIFDIYTRKNFGSSFYFVLFST